MFAKRRKKSPFIELDQVVNLYSFHSPTPQPLNRKETWNSPLFKFSFKYLRIVLLNIENTLSGISATINSFKIDRFVLYSNDTQFYCWIASFQYTTITAFVTDESKRRIKNVHTKCRWFFHWKSFLCATHETWKAAIS